MGFEAIRRAAKRSGKIGEATTASVLACLPQGFYVFNNVLLKWKGRGGARSTQIDHVVVSPYGIFVIETKNHKGVILGNMVDEYWTQALRMGRQCFNFRNPFYQNAGHIRTLSEQLGLPCNVMVGLVVFTNPEVVLNNVAAPCIPVNYLYATIMQYTGRPIWNATQTYQIACAIQSLNRSSRYNDAQHVKYVNTIKSFRGGV